MSSAPEPTSISKVAERSVSQVQIGMFPQDSAEASAVEADAVPDERHSSSAVPFCSTTDAVTTPPELIGSSKEAGDTPQTEKAHPFGIYASDVLSHLCNLEQARLSWLTSQCTIYVP